MTFYIKNYVQEFKAPLVYLVARGQRMALGFPSIEDFEAKGYHLEHDAVCYVINEAEESFLMVKPDITNKKFVAKVLQIEKSDDHSSRCDCIVDSANQLFFLEFKDTANEEQWRKGVQQVLNTYQAYLEIHKDKFDQKARKPVAMLIQPKLKVDKVKIEVHEHATKTFKEVGLTYVRGNTITLEPLTEAEQAK